MIKATLTVLMAIGLLAVSSPVRAYNPHVLRVGFAPWDSPTSIEAMAEDATRLLSQELHMPVEPEVTTDYTGVVEAMRSHKIDMAFFPPAAYVRAEKIAGAKVILKSIYQGRAAYYSAIVTRTDSGIRTLAALKGHSLALVDPTSTSGAIFPEMMLLDAGVNPHRDLRIFYAGGHDAVVLAVLNKSVDAGACYTNDPAGRESAWSEPTVVPNLADRKKIRILALSPPIPSDNIAVRRGLDPELVARIQQIFLALSSTPAGRAEIKRVYQVDGFAMATPADYAPIRRAFEEVGLPLK